VPLKNTDTPQNPQSRSLIVYLGNPILSSDRIGIDVGQRLAREVSGGTLRRDVLRKDISLGDVLRSTDIREFIGSPLDLISEIEGYERLVLIDAIVTKKLEVGQVALFREEELLEFAKAQHVHGLNLAEVIALSRRLSLPFPERILLIGIEVGDIGAFGDTLDSRLQDRFEGIYRSVREAVLSFLGETGQQGE
jgi:hydrogenase maturation protease